MYHLAFPFSDEETLNHSPHLSSYESCGHAEMCSPRWYRSTGQTENVKINVKLEVSCPEGRVLSADVRPPCFVMTAAEYPPGTEDMEVFKKDIHLNYYLRPFI